MIEGASQLSDLSNTGLQEAELKLSYADQIARLAEEAAASGQIYAAKVLGRMSDLVAAALRNAH